MRLVAVDPGSKPGIVELDWATGAVLRVSHQLHKCEWLWNTPWDIAVTEGQWYHGPKKRGRGGRPGGGGDREVSVDDLLTLAFRAGFTLACIPAARSLRIPPKVWRGPYGNLNKEQVQATIRDQLTAAERKLFALVPPGSHGDVLDSIGIARAARILAPTTKIYDWKPPHT